MTLRLKKIKGTMPGSAGFGVFRSVPLFFPWHAVCWSCGIWLWRTCGCFIGLIPAEMITSYYVMRMVWFQGAEVVCLILNCLHGRRVWPHFETHLSTNKRKMSLTYQVICVHITLWTQSDACNKIIVHCGFCSRKWFASCFALVIIFCRCCTKNSYFRKHSCIFISCRQNENFSLRTQGEWETAWEEEEKKKKIGQTGPAVWDGSGVWTWRMLWCSVMRMFLLWTQWANRCGENKAGPISCDS